MNRKGIIILIIAIIIITGGYFVFKKGEKADVIKIGCLTPLTGGGANYGKSTKLGVDFAINEFNNKFNKDVQVIYEDTRIDPTSAISAFNKLIFQKIEVVIGPFGSSVTNAIAPIANNKEIVLLGASATSDNIKDAGDFVFRITPPNSKQGASVADYAFNQLKKKKAAIFYQNNDYGLTLKESFEKKFIELGGEVIHVNGSDLNYLNFNTAISKIKTNDIDVVFFPLHVKESTALLKQLFENGINVPKLSCDGAMINEIIENGGNSVQGCYFSSLGLNVNNVEYKVFEEKFKLTHGFSPDTYTSYYYEATNIILEIIKNDKTITGELVKQRLYSIDKNKTYKGILGFTYFDEHGEVDKNFSMYKVKDNNFIMVK